MSILGIGIDMVKVSRVEAITGRWEMRFLDRIFTKQEQHDCLQRQRSHIHFSGRFAIKEALLKALGTGLSGGVRWKEIETLRGSSGQPIVKLSGRVRELAKRLGVCDVFLSISHDHDYAIGQVILQGTAPS